MQKEGLGFAVLLPRCRTCFVWRKWILFSKNSSLIGSGKWRLANPIPSLQCQWHCRKEFGVYHTLLRIKPNEYSRAHSSRCVPCYNAGVDGNLKFGLDCFCAFHPPLLRVVCTTYWAKPSRWSWSAKRVSEGEGCCWAVSREKLLAHPSSYFNPWDVSHTRLVYDRSRLLYKSADFFIGR